MGKMMDIKFRADEEMFTELQDLMNGIGQNALYMSHYELAEQTGMSPISWKFAVCLDCLDIMLARLG